MKKVIKANRGYLRFIYIISIIVPLLVALLLFSPIKLGLDNWVKLLPGVNAILNSTTALLMILALVAIKKKNIALHRSLMLTSLLLGALFLISYILYHSSTATTIYGDMNHDGVVGPEELAVLGNSRVIYLIILLSHIGLSIVVVPFVLFAIYFALSDQIERHKKVVKYTYPIWLYVSVTGVIVYLMISPYYF